MSAGAGRDDPRALQDAEYAFPYHYVARFGAKGFRQSLHDAWGICYVSTIEFMLARIAAARPGAVVDIGCGDGRFTRELSQIGAQRVAGVDFSPRAIALARAMNHDRPALSFHAVDIRAGWHGQPFDAAVLMEVLEHIPPGDAPAFLQAVGGMLRPGGRLFLTVPHRNAPLEAKHFRHFTAQSLREALDPTFEVRDLVPFERISWRRGVLDRLLGNRYFLLNHDAALRLLYRWYKRHLFACDGEAECRRLFVEATVR